MFFYIYDSFLTEKKYEKFLEKIETRLVNLGIAGKTIRLSVLKNLEEIIKDIEKKDSPTIVVIGNDQIFLKAAKALIGQRTPLGFIPVKETSNIAELLGLPFNEFCCDVISARLLETINLGKINPVRKLQSIPTPDNRSREKAKSGLSNGVNQEIFVSYLEMPAQDVILNCDKMYLIKTNKLKKIRIINLGLLNFENFSKGTEAKAAQAKDDFLEILIGNPAKKFLFFKTKEKLNSLIFAKEIEITSKKRNKKAPILLDGQKIIETPAQVSLSSEKIRLIVGRDRLI